MNTHMLVYCLGKNSAEFATAASASLQLRCWLQMIIKTPSWPQAFGRYTKYFDDCIFINSYRVSLISALLFKKGFIMSENQYVDKKIRPQHHHKTSPFDFRMDFECRGWPPQPQIFSSNKTKITKKCKISNFSFEMLEAVQAIL